jgi:hypothetical protein
MNKKLLALPTLALLVFMGAGCDEVNNTANQEQTLTEQNQSRLLAAQPPTKLDWSLERENINKRTKLWNDPNKVSYIYLINFGRVMAFYTIKGKVTSVDSQITNPEQLTSARVQLGDSNYHIVDGAIPSPSEDGSYGTNGDGVFFFTTEGAYVETKLEYILADQPLKITTQPELVREIK